MDDLSTGDEVEGDTDVDELLIFDSDAEEYKTIHQIQINEKDKAFLQALVDQDDFVTISDLKSITGISRQNLGYRFEKFGERYADIIDVEHQDAEESPYHSPPRMACITDKGKEAIKSGLIGNPEEDHITPTIELTKDDIEDIEGKFDQMQTQINSLQSELEKQQSSMQDLQHKLQDISERLSKLNSWKEDVKVFVLAVRYTFKNSDINFVKYLKKAKRERKEEELKGDSNN